MKAYEVFELLEQLRKERKKFKLEINSNGSGMNDFKIFVRHFEIKRIEDFTKINQ